MISTLYRGSVKDLLGPTRARQSAALIFEYSDGYSVFDWGRMPDLLPRKGEALAVLAAEFFEKLERPEAWKEFSRSAEALALRKANRFGGIFNELGEELQLRGLRTHYLGALENVPTQGEAAPKTVAEMKVPFRRFAVSQVSVVKPSWSPVLGRVLPDYYPTRISPPPRLIPLEVIFRFRCPAGSSLLERMKQNPTYLASLGFPDLIAQPGSQWDFPVLELFTKLEASDRPVSLSEALAISGLSAAQLQQVLLKTAWVAGVLKFWSARKGLELADGKLEWAISDQGQCFLIDAVGPDELRLMKDGVQISKEFLRTYYRNSKWYPSVEKAKIHARTHGALDWKRYVHEMPPHLPSAYREVASQLYLALANEFSERKWFPDAWPLGRVVEELKKLTSGANS